MNYHCDVLEAKLVLGESLIVSIASEFIENNGEDAERQGHMSEEVIKQEAYRVLRRNMKEYQKKKCQGMQNSLTGLIIMDSR